MAFELIFGEGTVPGSAQVYERLLNLQSREDVQTFCEQIRTRAAGGKEAIQNRQAQVAILDSKAIDLLKNGRYEESYQAVVEASQILGDFSDSQVEIAVKSLLSLKRFEEAAALAIHAQFWLETHDSLKPLLQQAYFQLGYRGELMKGVQITEDSEDTYGASSHTESEIRNIGQEDLEQTLQQITAINNRDWNKHLFLVLHMFLYSMKFEKNVIKIFAGERKGMKQKADEFNRRIESNKTLMTLFRQANFGTMNASELRFIRWFITAVNTYCLFVDPANTANDFSQNNWYQSAISNIATSLVMPTAVLQKIPNMDRDVFIMYMYHWANSLAQPVFNDIEDGESARMFSPFDDISLYVQLIAIMVVFGKQKLTLNKGKNDVFFCLCKILFEVLKQHNAKKRVPLLSREKLLKMFDLHLFCQSVIFADWRLVLVKEVEPSSLTVVPATNFEVTVQEIHDDITSILMSTVMNYMREPLIEYNLAWYILRAHWAEFFSRTIVELVGDAEKWVVGCFTVFATASIVTDYKKLLPFVNHKSFGEAFIKSISRSIAFMLNHECNILMKGEMTKGMMDMLANFIVCSNQSVLWNFFYKSSEGTYLCEFAFEQFLLATGTCVTPFCLAALLRGADETCRKRWIQSKYFRVVFRRLATKLFLLIMEPDRRCEDDETINFLLSFYVLVCGKPQLATFESALTFSEFQAHPRELFLSKMQRYVKGFATENRVHTRRNIGRTGKEITLKTPSVILKAGSIAAGIIVAHLTRNESFFKKRLLQDEKLHTTITTDFRKLLSK